MEKDLVPKVGTFNDTTIMTVTGATMSAIFKAEEQKAQEAETVIAAVAEDGPVAAGETHAKN